MRRAEAAGFKAVPTGIEHGTVTVVVDGTPFEVTTLREDVETFGRQAKVAFGRDWQRDAERRDFTMNALSAARDGTVYDYVGGLDDLAGAARALHRRCRQRALPRTICASCASFAFTPPMARGRSTRRARRLHRRAGRTRDIVARARAHGDAQAPGRDARGAGARDHETRRDCSVAVLGGVPLLASFANMIKLERALSLDARCRCAGWVRSASRWSRTPNVCASGCGSPISNTNGSRRWPTRWWQIWRGDRRAGGTHAALSGSGRKDSSTGCCWHGRGLAREASADDRWHALATLPDRWRAPVFPLKAADFIARGVAKGPALGARMRAAEEAWIAAGFPDEEAAIAAIADATVAELR